MKSKVRQRNAGMGSVAYPNLNGRAHAHNDDNGVWCAHDNEVPDRRDPLLAINSQEENYLFRNSSNFSHAIKNKAIVWTTQKHVP